MQKSNKGIPTTYNDVRFRSRLEAQWAAFFDLLGWRWEYEPYDLNGYIPDFILIGAKQHTAIEVKPVTGLDDYLSMPPIRRARADGPANC